MTLVKERIDDSLADYWDYKEIIETSKFLLTLLKFNTIEKEEVVNLTVSALQDLFKKNPPKSDLKIKWFSLYKNPDWTNKHVDFVLNDNKLSTSYKDISDFI